MASRTSACTPRGGDPISCFGLPDWIPYPKGAAFGEGLVVVTSGREVAGFSPNGLPLWRWKHSLRGRNGDMVPFLTDGGRSLALYDGNRTFYRFAVP